MYLHLSPALDSRRQTTRTSLRSHFYWRITHQHVMFQILRNNLHRMASPNRSKRVRQSQVSKTVYPCPHLNTHRKNSSNLSQKLRWCVGCNAVHAWWWNLAVIRVGGLSFWPHFAVGQESKRDLEDCTPFLVAIVLYISGYRLLHSAGITTFVTTVMIQALDRTLVISRIPPARRTKPRPWSPKRQLPWKRKLIKLY